MGAEARIDRAEDLRPDATDEEIVRKGHEMIQQAKYDYGHSGYSGTMAEASGVTVRRDLEFPTTRSVYEAIDDFAEKWGPAVAIRVDGAWYFAGIYSS